MSPRSSRGNDSEDCTLEPIAICGMACRLPGGVDSDSSFWRMLVEKRTGQTDKVPESRFNIDAHLHETLERPGSFNVPGGYFLDADPADFDPTFFNITPIEAQWLDPQQRRILEVAYESLVSAGVTLEGIAGSNTAVFVGSFTSDYQQMSIRDPDFRHNYAATGVDTGIISNRIGNIFNLKGPSFTINTACSSSIYALHNACHALRSRDCDAAIVGGVNLIITVDQHMNTAKLGILSPNSTCHTFDASADGYGRAEGAGALYIKRLADAIRDGDPIRGVVRATAVNTNGKVDGMGITHPSAEGQERVVRLAYEKAKLDPNLTAYAELHGTGTPVGDPIEVRAISRALNDRRPDGKPLLIGAVKPNIGHSEAASGIFAVMKAALMTEAAVIPGVALFKNINPNILEKEWNVKVHSNTAPWPKDSLVRRASVSSFGYGGTNGHVIIESADSLYPWYQHAKAKSEAPYDRSSKRPFLLCFASHDKTTLSRNVQAIGEVASKYYLTDLAHTLNLHRTMFSHRGFTVVREGQEAEAFLTAALRTGTVSKKATHLGFLFTGQGAQWYKMGRAALQTFPLVLETIEKLDQILARVSPKPSFRMADILLSDDESVSSRINDAEVTQPLCTAIQIALVDLFTQWDIVPEVSIGHSSGEIAAAYAAGLVSAPEAIILAYCRGYAVAENSSPGTMLAVGLGVEDVEAFLPLDPTEVCIACENSPGSVTLSGTAAGISDVQRHLISKGHFARELRTGRAYHSPHMAAVGTAYDIMLPNALAVLTEDDFLWCQARSDMVSSVTGELIQEDRLKPSYWSSNLRQRVLFNTAVQQLGRNTRFSDINVVIEIGPHSALSGPFKQICMANKLDRFTYMPSLVRSKNDADQLMSVAGGLFLMGYAVDLEEVNVADEIKNTIHKPRAQRLLVDLPPYQWNYEKTYWAEPRGSAEQRGRAYPRHDLLGSRVSGLTTHAQIWRNILRHRDIPWLKDHNLGGTAIFPAAGHLSLAIEALRQVHETEGLHFEGVTLRDVDIKTALVVPDTDDGVETIFRLQKPTDESDWYAFTVESLADGAWAVHCEGKISASHKRTVLGATPVDESALTQRVSGKRWYDAFDRVGFYYGKSFQQLQHARTDHSVNHAAGEVTVLSDSGLMQGESRYLIHPSTIDACLQLIIISIHAGKHKEMPWGVVPTHIEEISLLPAGQETPQAGHAVAWTSGFEDRKFDTHAQLAGTDGQILLDIKNLTCITYDAALPAGGALSGADREPFSKVHWQPDLEGLDAEAFAGLWPEILTNSERLTKLVELIRHRQSVDTVLLCGSPSQATVTAILDILPTSVPVTLSFDTDQALDLSEEAQSRVTVKVFPTPPEEWNSVAGGPYDLVIVESPTSRDAVAESAALLVKEEGWLLGATVDLPRLPRTGLQLGECSALRKATVYTNGTHTDAETITVLSIPEASDDKYLTETLASLAPGCNITEKSIMDFSAEEDHRVIICDTANTFFSNLLSDPKLFEAVKAVLTAGVPTVWLTSGVKEGSSTATTAGMAEGLIRTIRSEQAASRLTLVDFDVSESTEKVAQAFLDKLNKAATEGPGQDAEFWLHKGALHISRVYPNKDLNETADQTQETVLLEGVPLTAKTVNDRLVFDADCEVPVLSKTEVSIQVQASELKFPASGTPALICGTIIRVGSLLDSSLVGKRVVAFANDRLQTVVNSSAYAVIDEHTSPAEDLVRTLSPLITLANTFPGSQKPTVGEFCVSLPGPTYILATLVKLSRATSMNLGVVATSNAEREKFISDFLLQPEQVIVAEETGSVVSFIRDRYEKSPGSVSIIANDFQSLSKEVWRSIPASCHFLLVDASVDTAPDSLPFTRGASFIPINSKLMRASPTSAVRLLEQALRLVKTYPEVLNVTSSSPDSLNVVDVSHAAEVLCLEHRSEPAIVALRYGQGQITTLIKPKQSLSPEANYLLVGCLGGLGRSLTRWMIERGARHFAFLSRSGIQKPEAANLVESIQKAGAKTQVFFVDATDEEAVKPIVSKLNSERPIRGVVHAAMVLKDGMFEQMDHQSYVDCVLPKAKGALVLHDAVKDLNLDFFVMTSSISAQLGNTGQSNYSAANSVLDALASQRNNENLNATSLVLPMVLDVGVVAENNAIEISLARKGLYGIDEQEMLRGFGAAMFQQEPLIIMGMEARELAQSVNSAEALNAYWYNDPRFRHIRSVIEMSESKSGNGEANSFASTMKEALAEGPESVLQMIAHHIAKRMSSILMIPVEDFELDGPSLGSYGLDSMIGAEMRTWLFKEFGLDYPFQKLLAPILTFQGLARVVSEKLGLLEAVD